MAQWYQQTENVVLTDHAHRRMAHRSISLDDILLTIAMGTKIHRRGQVFFTMCKKNIPLHLAHIHRFQILEGVTVVADVNEPVIITVYRDRETAFSRIRRKHKRKLKRTYRPQYIM